MCVNMTTVEITCSRNVFLIVTLPIPLSEMYLHTYHYNYDTTFSGFRCPCPVNWPYRSLLGIYIGHPMKGYETCDFYPVAFWVPVDDSCKIEIQEYEHPIHEFKIELEYNLEYDLYKLRRDMDIARIPTLRSLPEKIYLPSEQRSCYEPCYHAIKFFDIFHQETLTGFINPMSGTEYKRVPIELKCDTVAIHIKMELTQQIFLEHFIPAT